MEIIKNLELVPRKQLDSTIDSISFWMNKKADFEYKFLMISFYVITALVPLISRFFSHYLLSLMYLITSPVWFALSKISDWKANPPDDSA